jgi:hypothetical protein
MWSPKYGSPLGCVVGVIALFPLGLSGIGIYGWATWYSLPENKRPEGMLPLWVSCTAGGLAVSLLLFWISIRILRRTNWRSFDRNKSASQM